MIREFRLKKGLTQAVFADKIGVTQGALSKAETGKNTFPYEVLYKLRLAFKFNVNAFIDKTLAARRGGS